MKIHFIRSRRNVNGGFTLIEAMLALGILSFGILGIALAQNAALGRGSASRHSLGASQVAKGVLEQVRHLPWSAIVETGNSGQDYELLCETDAAGGGCSDVSSSGLSGFPGAEPASLPNVLVTQSLSDGSVEVLTAYEVAWRVQNVGGTGVKECRRDVYVRVRWEERKFPTREYFLSTRLFNSLGDRDADPLADLGITSGDEGC